jgi:hypothetical protein
MLGIEISVGICDVPKIPPQETFKGPPRETKAASEIMEHWPPLTLSSEAVDSEPIINSPWLTFK